MSANDQLIKIFQYALNQEETGKNFFAQSLHRLNYGAAVTAFQRLIQEEEKHIEFLQKVLANLQAGRPLDPGALGEVVLPPTDYFADRARSEFLQQCLENAMIPDVTVFNLAWLIEKDLSTFYRQLADQAEGVVKEALTMLADWEAQHERFFRQFREVLDETYGRMPWGG